MSKRIDIEYTVIEGTKIVVPHMPRLSWKVANNQSELYLHTQKFILPANQSANLSLPIISHSNELFSLFVNPDKKTIQGGGKVAVKLNGDTAATETMPVAPRAAYSGSVTTLSATNTDTAIAELFVIKGLLIGAVDVDELGVSITSLNFLDLNDTPGSYSGFANHQLFVNAAANALELLPGNAKYITRTVTSDDALLSTDYILFVDCTSGDVTIDVPAAASNSSRAWRVIKIDTTSNSVIIDPNAAETINGLSSFAISRPGAGIELMSDGTNLKIVGAV